MSFSQSRRTLLGDMQYTRRKPYCRRHGRWPSAIV